MKQLNWIVPAIVVLGGAMVVLMAMRPPKDRGSDMQIHAFGRIPAAQDGRVKPMDTVARMALFVISGRQEYKDEDGNKQPAIAWLLDVMTSRMRKDDVAARQPVFRIENDQVLGLLHLPERPGNYRYSFEEIEHGIAEEGKPAKDGAPRKKPVLANEQNMVKLEARIAKARAKQAGERNIVDTKVLELATKLNTYLELKNLGIPHVVPPSKPNGDWQTLEQAARQAEATGATSLGAEAQQFVSLLQNYAAGNTSGFNSGVENYLKGIHTTLPSTARVASYETFFNNFAPFFQCTLLYIGVFLLAMAGWLLFAVRGSRVFWSSAFWLLVLVFCVHTFAIVSRIYISGRPPVTNLYSSAIFIGWVAVAAGIVIELLSRIGIASAVAALIGFATLIVAHNLGNDGDTMQVLQAVLDTNFWLWTHVTSVTIGYAATFVAGALGAVYILVGVFTPALKLDLGEIRLTDRPMPSRMQMDLGKLLGTLVYGVICFALLFSFVGTVLGGIWADQSWGRFWGWDPKENGAVLIVIWNALALHARWGGMVRQRGLAMLAVFGNVITLWSWFGVNMLGVGLHAYGFIPSAVKWLIIVGCIHFAIIAIGAVPARFWWSNQVPGQPPPRRTPRRDEAVEAAVVG